MLRLSSLADLPRLSRSPTVPYERDVQSAILEAMRVHPKIAWRARMNSGGTYLPGRNGEKQFVRFAFPGCSDIIGQTTITWGGRFIACEVKRPGELPTDVQMAFLDTVNTAGGIGFVARSLDDLFKAIPL